MKVYRFVLALVLVAAIGFSVWYVVSAYNEQRSSKGGLLVQEYIDASNDIY